MAVATRKNKKTTATAGSTISNAPNTSPRAALLSVGIARSDFASIAFSSPDTVLGYNLVVFDADNAFRDYTVFAEDYKGLPALDESKSSAIIADCKRRKQEFSVLLDRGGTFVLLVPPQLNCYVDTGARETSGTGANQKVARLVEPFDFLAACLPEPIEIKAERGEAIVLSEHPIAHLLRGFESLLYYESVIKSKGFTHLAYVPNTKHAVAAAKRSNNGSMLLLLRPVTAAKYSSEDAWLNDYNAYLNALLNANQFLSRPAVLQTLPDWARQVHTPAQYVQFEKIARLSAETVAAQSRLDAAQQELDEMERKKLLLTATGDVLEQAVVAVLRRLGLAVTEPREGRSDLILKLGNKRAVAEVKGLPGAAKEVHATEVERSVATFHAENGIEPKGILIVNAFCDTPLFARTSSPFPAPMLPYVVRKEIALVTTAQLFMADVAFADDPQRVEAFREAMFTTTGVVAGFTDAKEYLATR